MAGHDKESPSTLQALSLCAGANNAQSGLPDTFSPSSIKGTAAHQVLESVINGEEHLLTHESLHISVDTPGYTEDVTIVELERDELDAVTVHYDYIYSKWTETAEVHSEIKVDPSRYIKFTDSKGTADTLIFDVVNGRNVLEIVDYKGGRGHLVEIENCLQLITYGIGGVAMMDAEGAHVDDIILTIVQPLIDHKDGFIRSVTMTREELLAWAPAIQLIIKNSRYPKAKRTPGEYQCRHCKAKRDCPAIAEYAMTQVRATFTPLGELTTDDIGVSLTRDPNCLTPDQRALVLENATLVRGWLKEVEEFAWREDLKGRKTPGFKVVEGVSQRKYVSSDGDTIVELKKIRTLSKKRISMLDVTNTKILTPKKLLVRLKPMLSDTCMAKVKLLIKKPQGTLALVPNTDPRDAFVKKPEDVFKPKKIFKPIDSSDVDLSFLD